MDFIQAKESYRFSSDALLLADFASVHLSKNIFDKKRGIKPPFLFLDLGCGCGVIGIQILEYVQKNYPDYLKHTYILGIDKEKTLIESAHANAKAFGFHENYHAICADIMTNVSADIVQSWAFDRIEEQRGITEHAQGGVVKNPRLFDAIITNPPWYSMNRGEASHGNLRRSALFGDETSMAMFFGFAEERLKKNASLYVVGKNAYFHDCIKVLPASLRCTTMQNVHPTQGDNSVFFLLEARFQSKAPMAFLPPLFLNTNVL